jgi:glycosyltransferase involved in cell wall biosynthesis
MRILMLNRHNAYSVFGGDTVQMEKTATALRAMGHEIIVCLADQLATIDINFDVAHLFNIQTFEDSWIALQWLQKSGKPWVLSSIYWEPLTGWYGVNGPQNTIWQILDYFSGRKMGFGLYVFWQRLKRFRSRSWQMQRQLLKKAYCVLPNSMAEAKLLRHDFDLDRFLDQNNFLVVPNAIDVDLFHKVTPSLDWRDRIDGSGFVLEVGRISPEKNTLLLIEALWNLPKKLVFVGQANMQHAAYVEACYSKAKERGNVVFVEQLPHEQLPGIYALADVHVLPSWRETPGLASLEAAACGCSIVSTSVGCAYEYFGDMATYCDPWDIVSIREAVNRALLKPGSLELRKKILEQYTWERVAELTFSAYQQVLGR